MPNSKADKVAIPVITPTTKLVKAGLSTKAAKEMLPAMIRAWMALYDDLVVMLDHTVLMCVQVW